MPPFVLLTSSIESEEPYKKPRLTLSLANSELGMIITIKMLIKNNFFIKEIKDKPVANPQDFIVSWQIEKLEEDERLKIEAENQAKLKQMLDNIRRASEELDNKIKKNGGAVANG